MKQKIVITGGAGFVGANLTQYALKKGYRVLVVDTKDRLCRLQHMNFYSDPSFIFSPFNLTEDYFLFEDDVSAIIHLAALPQVDYSLHYPKEVVSNNIIALLKLMHNALEHNIPVLFASSVEVYGGNDGALFSENHTYNPLSPYAASKVAGEALMQSYMVSFGLVGTIVRLTNLYGPWQAPDRVLPRLITQILSNYPCEVDQSRLRDFLYVEDAVEALLGIVDQSLWGEAFNLSSGLGYNNFQLVSFLQEISEKTIDISFLDTRRRDGRGEALISSSQKLQTMLEWKPSVSLQDGIQRTYNWYASHAYWWRQFDSNIKSDRTGPQFLSDYTYGL
jgi:dTDP-glucose 4,6-dehydratase